MSPNEKHQLSRAAEAAAEAYGMLNAAKHSAELDRQGTRADEIGSLAVVALDLHEAIGELIEPTAVDGTTPKPST